MHRKKIGSKLEYKITMVFIAGVIIPMTIISIVISFIYKRNLIRSTSEASRLLAAQIESSLDTYLDNISQISLYPYYDEWMQQQIRSITLEGNENYAHDLEANARVSDFLFNMLIQNKYIRSVFLTDLEGNVIYAKSNGGAIQGDLDFFQSYIKEIEGEYMLIPTHRQHYLKRSNLEVFSYVRVIKDVKNNTPVGYEVLEIKADAIGILIRNMKESEEDYVAVYLQDGSFLWSNMEGISRENRLYTEEWPESCMIDGKKYLTGYSGSSRYGLKTIIYRDEIKILSSVNKISRTSICLILFILFWVLGSTFVFARKLTNPLNDLALAMQKVWQGDFTVRVDKKSEDEVGRLTEYFNVMLEKIDELILREYRMRLQEQEAKIRSLQDQINPHFLYNTLESITMMAEINDDVEVASMVTDLGSFFRFVISNEDNKVLLCSELEYVSIYVRIQNVRFDNRIHLDIQCREEWKEQEIIKLCIQPLVENSVLHGYGPAQQIRIQITVAIENGRMIIGVRDFGLGMEQESLADLIQNLGEQDAKTRSIGLNNVNQRLVLTYGEEAGLRFESKPGDGMYVWFSVPCQGEEERDDFLNGG